MDVLYAQHVILSLRYNELSWDYTAANADQEDEPVLWLEFDGSEDGRPVNKLLQVFSWQVGLDLWIFLLKKNIVCGYVGIKKSTE